MGQKFVDLDYLNGAHESVFEYNKVMNSRVCAECGPGNRQRQLCLRARLEYGEDARIRVRDAIAWAREILVRYSDENFANEEGGHQAAFYITTDIRTNVRKC